MKAPARDQRLEQLRAFGLFIRGEHTLYQIAQALGRDFVERNPSTAAGRARTRVEQGWRVICQARVRRWQRWWSGEFPAAAWQSLHGARLWTHPAEEPKPAAPEPSPFDELLQRIKAVEEFARGAGFYAAANGLSNVSAALRYHAKEERAPKNATK